jgi:hypothetical protein
VEGDNEMKTLLITACLVTATTAAPETLKLSIEGPAKNQYSTHTLTTIVLMAHGSHFPFLTIDDGKTKPRGMGPAYDADELETETLRIRSVLKPVSVFTNGVWETTFVQPDSIAVTTNNVAVISEKEDSK